MEKHAKEKHNNILARQKVSCIFCGAAYLQKLCLRAHVRRKHKKEAHFCPLKNCGKYYKTNEEMQAHVKESHEKETNEAIVACVVCGKRISSLRYRKNKKTYAIFFGFLVIAIIEEINGYINVKHKSKSC
jgi:adenine-specific DNA glycosylase